MAHVLFLFSDMLLDVCPWNVCGDERVLIGKANQSSWGSALPVVVPSLSRYGPRWDFTVAVAIRCGL